MGAAAGSFCSRERAQAGGVLLPRSGAGPRMGNEEEEASGEVGILAEVRARGGRQSLVGRWGGGRSGRGTGSSLGAGGVREGSDEADSAGFF